MENLHQDLRSLFVEIPSVSNQTSHEKMSCILMLYSKVLSEMLYHYEVSDYFSHLHTMCYEIKAIQQKHVNERHKHEIYFKTRAMLIQDLYRLITFTAKEEIYYQQAQ
jgi:hypothetical protein